MTSESIKVSQDHPLPASWKVEKGLLVYLAENGFEREKYDASWTPASILGIPVYVPNTKRHRWAIMLHDLHHVATGYGTDSAGEGQISAWECRRGIRSLGFYVAGIVLSGLLLGILVAPRKTLIAWKSSGRQKSLFDLESHSYDELLELNIGELRRILGLDEKGHYTGFRSLHLRAPGH